jgi:hypothetical protein
MNGMKTTLLLGLLNAILIVGVAPEPAKRA